MPYTTTSVTLVSKYTSAQDAQSSFPFSDTNEAIIQFTELCSDLAQVGLEFDVRPGEDESLLVFARAPKKVLRAAVYDLR